jgi:hypothetical protein
MTTSQQFFNNILYSNALTYEALDEIIGDLNKNVGLIANFFQSASQVIGSTATENYDLASAFGAYESTIQSDNTDVLQQSLQNVTAGIANTISYPTIPVSTHISTSINSYSFGISSSYLAGQIYSISASGLAKSSSISIPYTFDVSGYQFKSHIFDVPLDFAVYGIDNFNGSNYTNANLIKFDYSWSYATTPNLLVKLNYLTSSITKYYLTFYWGNSASLSTGYVNQSGISYVGTQNFIANIGIYTTSLTVSSITNVSGRNNFWSNTVPYTIGFNSNCFIDPTPYVWAPERINAILFDGTESNFSQPLRYPILNNTNFSSYLNGSSNYSYIFGNLQTTGFASNQGTNANLSFVNLFNSNYYQNYDTVQIYKQYQNDIPLDILIFQKNPKKTNLNYSNGYSLIKNQQIIPSAFVKVITDPLIWSNFANNLIGAKNSYVSYNLLISNYLSTLDNFIADFFFGTNFNNVADYFTGSYLTVSKNTLKEFTQPYGYNNISPLNFTEYEEKAVYETTNIISSKQYLTFTEGRLSLLDTYNLPAETNFEIFKPISYVCNGIDPYNQGNSLNFDYTLNLTFNYQNQNVLNKVLYLMASKYLISESDYQNMINNNQDVTGYYYLADPTSTDTSSYSVSSIDEFRLYGYAGLIPDLKDGVIRPILTRAFSPVDTSKYTYDQYIQYLNSIGITNPDDINTAVQEYLDAGNTFYTINLNTQSDTFVSLSGISICATNYALNQTPYWNSVLTPLIESPSTNSSNSGFTNLNATIYSGIVTSLSGSLPGYTIYNVPVGYNCYVTGVIVNSLGNFQTPGTYTSWIAPPSNLITNEQPAQIQYTILNSGILNPSSIQILNPGANFYFDFSTYLNVGFTTVGLGTTNANITVVLSNLARFTATVDSHYNLQSFVQTSAPAIGYNAGFKLNSNCFYGVGYTAIANVNILINNYPTVDSFLISNSNLSVGVLENLNNFQNPNTNLSSLNYTAGTQNYVMYENELFNSLITPSSYGGTQISYISIYCKLIEFSNSNPAGYIQANIYTINNYSRNLVASSEPIYADQINQNAYSTLNIPITYTFENTGPTLQSTSYWVSISQNLQGCLLSIQGSFSGITTSNYSISTSYIYNDQNTITIFGGISTGPYDLDLGKTTIGITSIFGSNSISTSTNSLVVYLRRDTSYGITSNQISVSLNTINNSQSNIIVSNPVNISSLSTTFTGIGFTFNSSISSSTTIGLATFIFSDTIGSNQVYIGRSLGQYDVSQIGLATSSQIGVGATDVNFNFFFNRLFNQVSNTIYGAFNYTDNSQFGLAKPNTLRVMSPVNVVDGYWSFRSTPIFAPVSIYPRAFLSNSSIIGTSSPSYQYVGYTHDIWLNIGYNSGGVYYQPSPIYLPANPTWQATWMTRNTSNYTDFDVFNVVQNTYLSSINYQSGTANTTIGVSTSPLSAIFEGTFYPQGNLSVPVPLTIGYGASSGVQVFINNSTQPFINTFNVIPSVSTSVTASLSTSVRDSSVNFKIYYFTLSTASISVSWNVGSGNTLVNYASSNNTNSSSPVSLNSGYPIDQIVFMNISQTQSEAISVNNGFPPGDSFVIRSS